MFHVKHRRSPHPAQGPTRRAGRRPVRLAALALAAVALLALGCTANIGSPDGWTAPVRVGELTIVQERRGELIAIRLDGDDDVLTEDVDERIVWRFPGENDDVDLDAVYANLIVDGDVLYVAGYSGDVVALDLSLGAPRAIWLRTLDDHIIATPAFDGRTLYVATEGGVVVPIEVEGGVGGAPLVRADDRIWSQPAIDGGAIYVPGLDKRVRAVGLSGGEERWSTRISGAAPGNPTLESELLLVGSFDRTLHALDRTSGNEEWAFDGDGWFWAQPLVAGDVVYAATTRGSVYALNLRGGDGSRERWRFNELDSEIRVAPIIAAGVLVVAAEEGIIFGIDPATGDTRWTETLLGNRFLADPLVLGSTLIYATTRGDLIELDPQSGASRVVYERS